MIALQDEVLADIVTLVVRMCSFDCAKIWHSRYFYCAFLEELNMNKPIQFSLILLV
jgi:hypothetical protein